MADSLSNYFRVNLPHLLRIASFISLLLGVIFFIVVDPIIGIMFLALPFAAFLLVFPIGIVYVTVIMIFIDFTIAEGKIVEVFPILLVLFTFLFFKEKLGLLVQYKTYVLTLFIILITASCSLLFSNYPNYTLDKIVRYFLLLSASILFVAFFHKNKSLVDNVINLFLALGVINSISIYIEKFIFGYSRPFGISGVPTVDILVFCALISLIYFIYNKNKSGVFYLLIFGFISSALFLTLTRNSILTLALVIGIYSLFLLFNPKLNSVYLKKIGLAFLFFFVAFIGMNFLNAGNVQSRYGEIGQSDSKVTSIHTRILIWDTAISAIQKNLLTGVGFNTFAEASKEYYTINKKLFDKYVRNLDAHNPFLDYLAGTGIIGTIPLLVAFFILVNLAVKQFSSNIPEKVAISLSILAVILSFFYSGAWLYGQNSMQFALFLSLFIVSIKEEEVNKNTAIHKV